MKFSGIRLIIPLLLIAFITVPSQGQGIGMIILSNIELVTVDESSASVTWVTSLPSNTIIEWGPTADLGQSETIDETEIYHIAKISGLEQGTTYYYRIGSESVWSDISSFTTLTDPGGGYEGKIAVISDTHYDRDGKNTINGMMYGESQVLLNSLVSELNADTGIDMVIATGDLTNGDEEDYIGFVNQMNQLKAPWYPVLGNHDKQFRDWNRIYTNTTGLTETYYKLEKGSYDLIILDSAEFGQVSGNLDDEQLKWFEDQLKLDPDKPVIVFMHHLADRTDINGIDEQAKNKLDRILDENINAFSFHSGHIHKNLFTEGTNKVSYISTAAVVSYPVGYSKIKLYDNGYTQSFFKIEDELDISEESRLRVNTASSTSDEEALGRIEDRSFVDEKPKNQPPVIISINADPLKIIPGGTSTLSVSASDPDGDALTFSYEPESGRIENNGATAIYTAPAFPGFYSVRVEVSDGEYSVSGNIEIEVSEEIVSVQNRAPKIEDIYRTATVVTPNEIVSIEVIATDPDNDPLTYLYTASGGEISGTGSKVDWLAPANPGTYTITIVISDGKLTSEKSILTITVSDQEQNEESQDAPGFEAISIAIAFLLISFVLRCRK